MAGVESSQQLSRATLAALAVSFLAGLGAGAISYAQRSPVRTKPVAGTHAIAIHLALAAGATVTVLGVETRRRREKFRRTASPWRAPFTARMAKRWAETMRFARGASPLNLARSLATALLTVVAAFAPFRMGDQIVGGLDPNFTVNAWGGPSYFGALLAHWLDCALGFYAACLLLHVTLLDAPAAGIAGRSEDLAATRRR